MLLLSLPLPFTVHLSARLDFERIRCEVIYAASMGVGTSGGALGVEGDKYVYV